MILNENEILENVKEALSARAVYVISEMMDNPDQLVPQMSRAQASSLSYFARVDHPEDVKGDAGGELPEGDIEVSSEICDNEGQSSDSCLEDAFDHAIQTGGDLVITLADGTEISIDPHTALKIKNSVIGSIQNYLGSIEQFAAGTGLDFQSEPESDDEYEDAGEE